MLPLGTLRVPVPHLSDERRDCISVRSDPHRRLAEMPASRRGRHVRLELTAVRCRITSTRAMRVGAGVLALATVFVSCSTAPPPHLTLARLEELHSAVDSGRELPRPRLPSTADTNAAAAYYQFAEPLVRFGAKLDTAEMALYWASRLDPAWPDPIYARGMVLLRALQQDAFQTWLKTRSIKATRHLGLSPRQVQQGAIEQYRLFSAHAAQADSNRIRADR